MRMVMKDNPSQFKFRRNEVIGRPAAEEDQEFLAECFEETGDLETLCDPSNPQSIVVGRTGAGKSAILLKMAENQGSVLVDPADLALNYLSNSTILRTLEKLDVHLDQFFKVLWKHIFIIELIRIKFPMNNQEETKNFFSFLRNFFGSDDKKARALKYLEDHEDTFFKTTELRIKEITGKLENSITGSFGVDSKILKAGYEDKDSLSYEEKVEAVHRAQDIVNQAQLTELNTIFLMMKQDIFDKAQPPYFILIDKLDENWVDEMFRYRLIRALLDTIREFIKIPGVKIVIALRKDLIDRVLKMTGDPGTQREKYQSLYISLDWSKEHLLHLLDKRVNFLVKRRYSGGSVTHADLLPSHVGPSVIGEYLVERTLYRPRDIIMFFNACIDKAVDHPKITLSMLREAETDYSAARLRAVCDEWRTDFPDLEDFAPLLKRQPSSFTVASIDLEKWGEFCLNRFSSHEEPLGILSKSARQVAEGEMQPFAFAQRVLSVFYRVGLVGLKTERYEAVRWSFLRGADIPASGIDGQCGVSICPAFYYCFGIKSK